MMPALLGWGIFGHVVVGWSLGKGEEGSFLSPSLPTPDVCTQARHLLGLHGSTCMENLGSGIGTSPRPTKAASLLGGSSPFAAQLCPNPTAGQGGISSSWIPGFSLSSPPRPGLLLCGVGRAVNECKGRGDLPRFGERRGCSKLRGEHASLCARACSCARVGTHVAVPLLGTSMPKP